MIVNFDQKDMQDNDGIELYLESSAIKSLIVHDDQVGPFSKMTFTDEYGISLSTEWIDPTANGKVDAFIDVLAVMNIPKIRIRFSSMLEIVRELNELLFPLYRNADLYVSWDIKLVNVCTLKQEIRSLSEEEIDRKEKLDIVKGSYPRYIWTVDLSVREDDRYEGLPTRISSFYFDATDMDNAGFFLFGLVYDKVGWISKVAFDDIDTDRSRVSSVIRQIQKAYLKADHNRRTSLISHH